MNGDGRKQPHSSDHHQLTLVPVAVELRQRFTCTVPKAGVWFSEQSAAIDYAVQSRGVAH